MLYQLSYTHHARSIRARPAEKKCTGSARVLAPELSEVPEGVGAGHRTCFAAIALAVSESGPGWGTKTASR